MDVDVADVVVTEDVVTEDVVAREDVAATVDEVHLAGAIPSSMSTTNPPSHPYLEILSTVDRVPQGSEKCICRTLGRFPAKCLRSGVAFVFCYICPNSFS